MGPLSVAGAQFLLSLLLIRHLDLPDFGRFAFLSVLLQFSTGLWSALFAAPLLVAATRSGADEVPRALAAASSLALLPVALAFAGIGRLLGADMAASCGFAAWSALVLLRYFARAWSLVHRQPVRTIASDVCYGIALVAGAFLLQAITPIALVHAALLLLASACCGLAPFARPHALRDLLSLRRADAVAYRSVWRRDARWSLLGVLTTEATVNSQSYIVTAISGAGGFAPIAATALLIRPVTVAINALTEFERARFADDLQVGRLGSVHRARAHLRWALLAIWGATLLLAIGLLSLAPALLFHDKFNMVTLWTGALLWFAVVLSRGLHAPDGAILLAAGRFRKLASMSSATALISLASVLGLLLSLGPIWSIGGIFLGESCFALALFRAAREELRSRDVVCRQV